MTLQPLDSFGTLRGVETMLEEVAEVGLRRLVIDQADSPLEGMLLTALAGVVAVRASLADVRLGWDEHHIPDGDGIERVAGLNAFSDDHDLSDCAYYRRHKGLPGADPKGTCSYGCNDEPACITDEPLSGWPAVRHLTTGLL